MRSKERSECMKRARIDRGLYQCEMCEKGKLTRAKDVQIDHINPTVPLSGWDGFDGFIERLFCKVDLLRVLCKTHHEEVTKAQTEVRKKLRKDKKR